MLRRSGRLDKATVSSSVSAPIFCSHEIVARRVAQVAEGITLIAAQRYGWVVVDEFRQPRGDGRTVVCTVNNINPWA